MNNNLDYIQKIIYYQSTLINCLLTFKPHVIFKLEIYKLNIGSFLNILFYSILFVD